MKLAWTLAALTLLACGGDDSGGGSPDGSASSVDAAVTGVMCTGTPASFPTFATACTGASDCTIAFHQISCCGTRRALGISKSAKSAFDSAEATCEAQYPGCGCAQGPTSAEDGKSTTTESAIQVTCTPGGACSTLIP